MTRRWTGNGGGHDVKAESGSFHSGTPQAKESHTFSHTFTDEGVSTYLDDQHAADDRQPAEADADRPEGDPLDDPE